MPFTMHPVIMMECGPR